MREGKGEEQVCSLYGAFRDFLLPCLSEEVQPEQLQQLSAAGIYKLTVPIEADGGVQTDCRC